MTLVPSVIEKTKAWERAYDIYSRLLEDRIIFVGDTVDSALVIISRKKRSRQRYSNVYKYARWRSL